MLQCRTEDLFQVYKISDFVNGIEQRRSVLSDHCANALQIKSGKKIMISHKTPFSITARLQIVRFSATSPVTVFRENAQVGVYSPIIYDMITLH